MPTLALLPTLDQQAIQKKIEELAAQLPVEARIEVNARIEYGINEELADKKSECGKNKHKWKNYLEEHGITQKDAAKRIKLLRVPKLLWSVGTIMIMQLAAPMYEETRDRLLQEEVITQELVEYEMAAAREMRKQEKEAATPNIWRQDKNGKRYWHSGNVYGYDDAGVTLQDLIDKSGKLPQSIIVDAIMQFANNLPPEYLPQEQPRQTPALSEIEPGMRVKVHSHQFAGEMGTVLTPYDGQGWSVMLDCHKGQEAAIPTRLRPSQIEIV